MTHISVLIPTMEKRALICRELVEEVKRQFSEIPEIVYEILVDCDNGEITIGAKRNRMLKNAKGVYCAFLDDDDAIHPHYFQTFKAVIFGQEIDVAELTAGYYGTGRFVKPVHYSLKHDWSETPSTYLRPPHHLNVMKTELARTIGYPDVRGEEDRSFAIRLREYAKTHKLSEFPVDTSVLLYHYLDGIKDTRANFTISFDEKGHVNLVKRK